MELWGATRRRRMKTRAAKDASRNDGGICIEEMSVRGGNVGRRGARHPHPWAEPISMIVGTPDWLTRI